MDVVTEVLETCSKDLEKFKSISVDKKPIDVEYDLGYLLLTDENELDKKLLAENEDDYILNLTRDNVQLLLNKLWDLPTRRVDGTIVVDLPKPVFVLPRAKHVPKPRLLTKWEQFAKLKGIKKRKRAKLTWDDQLKKWIPLHGYKKSAARKEKEWLLEVPNNANPMEDQFEKKRIERGERIAKNELQRLRNIAKSKKVELPRVGILNSDVSTAKDLQTAITVARSSTASVGKFQDKMPREKEARGVAAITPGASRKRKLPPVSGDQEKSENMAVIESVLNKRPKLDIQKAVNRHINQEQLMRSEEKNQTKPKAGRNGKKRLNSNTPKSGKKPKGGKGQRKGKVSGGRKRR